MGKKKAKPFRGMMESLKTWSGSTQHKQAAKFATTVKADAQVLAASAKKHSDGFARFSLPASIVSAKKSDKPQADRNLRKLANDMFKSQKSSKPKKRRSRLPIVILMLVALCGWGGYKAVEMISRPHFKVSHLFDYNKWLQLASGAKHPGHKSSSSYVSSGKNYNYGSANSYRSGNSSSRSSYSSYGEARSHTKLHKASHYKKSRHAGKVSAYKGKKSDKYSKAKRGQSNKYAKAKKSSKKHIAKSNAKKGKKKLANKRGSKSVASSR